MHCTGATTVGNTMSLEFHSAFNANVGAGSILVRNLWWREGGWESIDQQGNKMMPTATGAGERAV